MFPVEMDLRPDRDELTLGSSAQPGDRVTGAAWVTADLVFQLLIVFALGMTEGSPIFKMFQVDRSAVRGPETPSHEKELRLRVFLVGEQRQEPVYRVIIYSNLDNETRSDDTVHGIRELAINIRRRLIEARDILEKEPELRIIKSFLAPRDSTHELALRCYADLQAELGGGWLMGAYDPERLKKLAGDEP